MTEWPPNLSRRRVGKGFAGLVVLVVIAYFAGLDGPLLFDDRPALTGNPLLVFNWTVFDEWRTAILSSDAGPFKRPLAMLSFAVNHALSEGFDPFALKIVNLLIHLLCGWVIYRLVICLVRSSPVLDFSPVVRNWLPLLTALLWLLSPLHVSTVLYAVQRMTQLSALFVLMGLLHFCTCRAQWAIRGASASEVVATVLWLALWLGAAAFSKENGLLLLWLLPLSECIFFRGHWNGKANAWLRKLGWIGLIAPLVVLVMAFLLAPELFHRGYGGRQFSLDERLLTQLRVLWQYLGWMVWPDISGMSFQHDDISLSKSWTNPWTTLLAGLAWLSIVLLAVYRRIRWPLFFFGIAFFLIGHSMESSFWPLEMVYEHRNYLPSVGVHLLLGWLIIEAVDRSKKVQPVLVIGALAVSLTVLTALRSYAWSDSELLARVNVQNHPRSARSNYFYGLALIERYERQVAEGVGSRLENQKVLFAALHYYERMLQENPGSFAALATLYHLYERYLPQYELKSDWFNELVVSAQTRVLQVSDRLALRFLVDCYEKKACSGRETDLLHLLGLLQSRYEQNPEFLLLEYRLRRLLGEQPDALEDLLVRAQDLSHSSLKSYSFAIKESIARGDIASAYLAAGAWLANDHLREQLPFTKRMFQPDGNGKE